MPGFGVGMEKAEPFVFFFKKRIACLPLGISINYTMGCKFMADDISQLSLEVHYSLQGFRAFFMVNLGMVGARSI